jgi:hypothetical protein
MSVVHVVVDHLPSSEHSDAYFALVGALGGAVVVGLLGLVNQLLRSRSESKHLERQLEHDRQQRDRSEQRTRIVAARLVYDELRWVSGALRAALNQDATVTRKILAGKALDDVWREQRAVLGSEMDDQAWRRVSTAIERTRLSVGAPDEPDRDIMETWLNSVDDAIVDLWMIAFPTKLDEKMKDPIDEWKRLRDSLRWKAEQSL